MPKYHRVTSETWHAGKPAPCVSLNVGKARRQCQIRREVKSWKKSDLNQREKKRKKKGGRAYSRSQCVLSILEDMRTWWELQGMIRGHIHDLAMWKCL